MADSPQKAAIESSGACRDRLLEESRSNLRDDNFMQKGGNLKELSRLGFPNFEITQEATTDKTAVAVKEKVSSD